MERDRMPYFAPYIEHGKVGVQLERRLDLPVHGAAQSLKVELLLGRAQTAARQRHVAAKHKVDDWVALAHFFAATCRRGGAVGAIHEGEVLMVRGEFAVQRSKEFRP